MNIAIIVQIERSGKKLGISEMSQKKKPLHSRQGLIQRASDMLYLANSVYQRHPLDSMESLRYTYEYFYRSEKPCECGRSGKNLRFENQ